MKTEWEQYRGQMIATAILLFAGIGLGLLGQWGLGYLLQAGILVYDFILIYKGKDTITKWARKQLPGWADKIIMVALLALIIKYAASGDGWAAGYWFLLGTINGHINWER